MKCAVFASGNGSNFSALCRAQKKKRLSAEITLLVCDNPDAMALQRAQIAGIPALLVRRSDYPDKNAFEEAIIKSLKEHGIELIILAGYMRLLSSRFIEEYRGRIVNIHPSLLPAFKGAHAIRDAFEYGVKVTGVTVHFVDEQVDNGPIILQRPLLVESKDTLESLEAKIHKLEHMIYPEAVNLVVRGKVIVDGRKVREALNTRRRVVSLRRG